MRAIDRKSEACASAVVILGALVIFAAVLVPAGFAVFVWAEGYAKRNGKLKRQG